MPPGSYSLAVRVYRLRGTDGTDLGRVAHPVPNLTEGDLLADGSLNVWWVLAAHPPEKGFGDGLPILVVEEACI